MGNTLTVNLGGICAPHSWVPWEKYDKGEALNAAIDFVEGQDIDGYFRQDMHSYYIDYALNRVEMADGETMSIPNFIREVAEALTANGHEVDLRDRIINKTAIYVTSLACTYNNLGDDF